MIIDMMHAFYGRREVVIDDKVQNENGEIETRRVQQSYDFSALPVDALDLNIQIGAASYWAQTLQVTTLDNLMNAKIIPDAIEYLDRVPDGMVKDKNGLMDAVKRAQEAAQAAAMQQAMGGGALG